MKLERSPSGSLSQFSTAKTSSLSSWTRVYSNVLAGVWLILQRSRSVCCSAATSAPDYVAAAGIGNSSTSQKRKPEKEDINVCRDVADVSSVSSAVRAARRVGSLFSGNHAWL